MKPAISLLRAAFPPIVMMAMAAFLLVNHLESTGPKERPPVPTLNNLEDLDAVIPGKKDYYAFDREGAVFFEIRVNAQKPYSHGSAPVYIMNAEGQLVDFFDPETRLSYDQNWGVMCRHEIDRQEMVDILQAERLLRHIATYNEGHLTSTVTEPSRRANNGRLAMLTNP